MIRRSGSGSREELRDGLRDRRAPGRGAIERYVRGSWGEPGAALRGLAAVYGAITDLRNGLWDAGVFRPRRVAAPVISIGGLSTGGSGKTPLTAAVARMLADAGLRPAVVTPGQGDELRLHAEINPDIPVSGGRWRTPLARAAVAGGAEVVLLDSGFQHRRLHRDLDIVACNVDQAAERDRLPAGPYRERFAAVRRADAAVLVRRAASAEQAEELERELSSLAPGLHVAHVEFRSAGPRPANDAAAEIGRPDPAVAVAGVMWPETFFRWLPQEGLHPEHRVALPDHARYDAGTSDHLAEAAGRRGLVCTRKDAVRLAAVLPREVPVWWLAEALDWQTGAGILLAGIRRAAGGAA